MIVEVRGAGGGGGAGANGGTGAGWRPGSCDAAAHNGPVPGGSGGDGLAPTDPASLGLDTAAPRSGISSSYLPPTCLSTPIGGTGGGGGFAGAGGDGGAGASSGNGASGHGGLVLITFLR